MIIICFTLQPPPMPELQPADVASMLKPAAPFEGLRIEGENIHRGRGNFKVSKSTFSRNRVHSQSTKIWHIKEYDKLLLGEKESGLFYSGEGYVVRWAYLITVVRELEGLTPGKGGFAQDRKYQRMLSKERGEVDNTLKKEVKNKDSDDEGDLSDDGGSSGDEMKSVLESGGRDRCAYFFWQGQ